MNAKDNKSNTKDDKSNVTHNPHDHIVKKLLSAPEMARDVLTMYLPQKILSLVDLNILELQNSSFIDDQHRAFAVDLLYRTQSKSGDDNYIYVLIEHQSKSDPLMSVRLFNYMGLIWEQMRKESPKQRHIPLIYPLVIYNGKKPYSYSLNLSDLFASEEEKAIFSTLFTRPFLLVDLASIQDHELREHLRKKVSGVALLMALKHIFDQQLQTFFERDYVQILHQLDQAGGTDTVADILYYFLEQGELTDEETFWDAIRRELPQRVGEKAMTLEQRILARGEARGIALGEARGIALGEARGIALGEARGEAKGEEKAKLAVAEHLLAGRPDLSGQALIAWVSSMTELSIEKVQTIYQRLTNKFFTEA